MRRICALLDICLICLNGCGNKSDKDAASATGIGPDAVVGSIMPADISLDDLRIGSVAVCMKSDEFLEAAASEGADSEQREKYRGFFNDFGSFEYNGLTLRYHDLADCITGISYKGSDRNYSTSRGITVGSAKADVINAYGPPDVGLMETDAWTYLLDKPYWMSGEGFQNDPSRHYGDGMTFVFSDGRVTSIEGHIFISGS